VRAQSAAFFEAFVQCAAIMVIASLPAVYASSGVGIAMIDRAVYAIVAAHGLVNARAVDAVVRGA
jgi:hypothetical protein